MNDLKSKLTAEKNELKKLTNEYLAETENPTDTHDINKINNLILQIEYYIGRLELLEELLKKNNIKN